MGGCSSKDGVQDPKKAKAAEPVAAAGDPPAAEAPAAEAAPADPPAVVE